MTVRTVGILSTGEMGAATGNVLRDGGLDVVTNLEGRSDLTRARAAEAGIRDVGTTDEVVRQSDLLLSVLVPAEAVALGEQVSEAMRQTGATPVYAECNAIAPQTVERVATLIMGAGATFIDAGIIGSPPSPGGRGARFYCSGPDTSAFEALTEHGLNVRRAGPGIGQASGLKMVYAASTKGTYALWTELLVAARAMELDDALLAEFATGDSTVSDKVLGSIPGTPRRVRRWVGEMEEIALTFGSLGMTSKLMEGAAEMFRLVGGTPLGDQTTRDPDPELDTILDVLAKRIAEPG